ncbi:MAG: Asp-tRNA(Asn)/Glu-tRNA(Gln) amidotransferase subunit GatC [Alphaproteobacteria bacterium]|nr:Asp-tRNA(Asn)/Glu-tRNA(Gln) amidotransferase subunit GatC [Alphaproteobacteria bacterium]
MALDKATVARIAHLARIRVPDRELAALTGELTNILSWVEQLDEIDTSDVPPLTSVTSQELPRRPDAVTDGGYPDQVLANAPAPTKGFFTVPKVVE